MITLDQIITGVKITLLIIIISIPFVDYKRFLSLMDINMVKITMLVLIAFTSFINIEIAILLTIMFFLIVISGNAYKLSKLKESAVAKLGSKDESFTMKDFPQSECPLDKKIKPLNTSSYYLDDKIKPYEEYVRLMGGNEENLHKAAEDNIVELESADAMLLSQAYATF